MFKRIRRIIIRVTKEIIGIVEILRAIILKTLFPERILLVKAWVRTFLGKTSHYNWGDDLNVFFLSLATGKKVVIYPDTYVARFLRVKNYMCIGSLVSSHSMKDSIVWGTGVLNDVKAGSLKDEPYKIAAVRGPLTKKWLESQGIECPAVYGDPALLLPLFYKPQKIEHYKMGIVPHYSDMDNSNVRRLLKRDGVRLIQMRDYIHWQDVIDEISACDFIISSSLHGLIVAEAYGIPAIWVEFKEYVSGWEYKFYDFYASIGKENSSYIKIEDDMDVEKLEEIVQKWSPGKIDLKPLLNSCPFELKINEREELK